MFQIMEIEKCVSPVGGRPAIENEAQGEQPLNDSHVVSEQVNNAMFGEVLSKCYFQLSNVLFVSYKLARRVML